VFHMFGDAVLCRMALFFERLQEGLRNRTENFYENDTVLQVRAGRSVAGRRNLGADGCEDIKCGGYAAVVYSGDWEDKWDCSIGGFFKEAVESYLVIRGGIGNHSLVEWAMMEGIIWFWFRFSCRIERAHTVLFLSL
jgi:hypothetical protein